MNLKRGYYMKTGIIVYSKTGNTFYVGQRLRESLEKLGQKVFLERIGISGSEESGKFELSNSPDVSEYDLLILGSPVHGFSLCPVMTKYISEALAKDKKVICFVTQFFAFPWLGGNRAVRQMKSLCTQKDLSIIYTEVINWSSKKREEQILNLIDKVLTVYKA